MAFKERLKDGQKLLNDFFILVKIESALEGFLESFYTSFAEVERMVEWTSAEDSH